MYRITCFKILFIVLSFKVSQSIVWRGPSTDDNKKEETPLDPLAFTLVSSSSTELPISDEEILKYLDKYKYINMDKLKKQKIAFKYQDNNNNGNKTNLKKDLSIDDVSCGIKMFQKMAGLEITGKLDDRTRAKMGEPRCQLPDFIEPPDCAKRTKRQASWKGNTNKWGTNDLKYRILNHTKSGMLSVLDVERLFEKALHMWGDVTPLTFSLTDSKSAYHVGASFQIGNHGDDYPFTSVKTLAHTFFPPYQNAPYLSHWHTKFGNMHFNDKITWTKNTNEEIYTIDGPDKSKKCVFPFIYRGKSYQNCFQLSIRDGDKEPYRYLCATTTILFSSSKSWGYCGQNFFQAAVHEIGHVLGLNHIDNNANAVMYPWARPYTPDYKLHQADINAIQKFYGGPGTQAASTTSGTTVTSSSTFGTSPSPTTNFVHAAIDYPRINECTDASIDAITTNVKKETLIFKGAYYYKINWVSIEVGYPKLIRDVWGSVPDDIDAAHYTRNKVCRHKWINSSWKYECPETDLHFFFKGKYVWRFENEIEISKSLINDTFIGLPNDIDAIFHYPGTNYTYVTKDFKYYKLTMNLTRVAYGYPRDLFHWFINSQIFDITGMDAGYIDPNGDYFYFFIGKKFYYFDHRRSKPNIPESYPKPTSSSWFGCPKYDSIVLEKISAGKSSPK